MLPQGNARRYGDQQQQQDQGHQQQQLWGLAAPLAEGPNGAAPHAPMPAAAPYGASMQQRPGWGIDSEPFPGSMGGQHQQQQLRPASMYYPRQSSAAGQGQGPGQEGADGARERVAAYGLKEEANAVRAVAARRQQPPRPPAYWRAALPGAPPEGIIRDDPQAAVDAPFYGLVLELSRHQQEPYNPMHAYDVPQRQQQAYHNPLYADESFGHEQQRQRQQQEWHHQQQERQQQQPWQQQQQQQQEWQHQQQGWQQGPQQEHGLKRPNDDQLNEGSSVWGGWDVSQHHPCGSGGGGPGLDPSTDPFAAAAAATAAAFAPEPEPDYGIVVELKEPGPRGDDDAFGLAAEVARRRGKHGPAAWGARFGPGSAMRPRKRLAAVGPPAAFGMAPDGALLTEQDPFDEANRLSGRDPFVMAVGEDGVKFPVLPFESPDQELVQGPVPLLVPPDGDQATSAVSGDGQQYGLADELGAGEDLWRQQELQFDDADASEAMQDQQRQQLQHLMDYEPPGPKYQYNEDTGMLYTLEVGDDFGERAAREFIEDGATGQFYKLNAPGLWRRLARVFGRKQPGQQEEEDDEDLFEMPEDPSFKAGLKLAATRATNLMYTVGIFLQGLLTGYAIIIFLLSHELYSTTYSTSLTWYLQYYSPAAVLFSRVYFTLVAVSAIAATARFAKDLLQDFQPSRVGLRYVDALQLLVYGGAYVVTLLCTPTEYNMTFAVNKDASYFNLTLTQTFLDRVKGFQFLNLIRCALAWAGWLLVCYQHSPFVMEATVQREVKQFKRHMKLTGMTRRYTISRVSMQPPLSQAAWRDPSVASRHTSRAGREQEAGGAAAVVTASAATAPSAATLSSRRVSRSARSTREEA